MTETFVGTSGQYLSLAVEESSASAITGATITVLSPSGAVVANGALTTYQGGGASYGYTVVNLGPLPSSGNYTAYLQQVEAANGYGIYGTGTLTFTLASPVTGP